MKIYPFNIGDARSALDAVVEKVCKEISALDNQYVLKASPAELEQHFVDKATIQPLVLHIENQQIENHESTTVDVTHDFRRAVFPGRRAIVPGTKIDISIPFDGDEQLWKFRPSTFSMCGYPEIEIRGNSIIVSYSAPDDSLKSTELRNAIDRDTSGLQQALSYLKNDVEDHNSRAAASVQVALSRKRALAQTAVEAVHALGIPIKRRDVPPTYVIPATRKKLPIRRPEVAASPYEPEPILDETEYNHILAITQSMSLMFERSPAAFARSDEETIRNHFLLQLNGHYDGGATGETFNSSGKTDILIRSQNRNVFIAECKFWNGSKSFDGAVSQLLGYLSWRDVKCALLIFNKKKGTSAVRKKMHELMIQRVEFRKILFNHAEGDSRYIFVKEADPGKEIIITTQLFDLPLE